MFSRTISADIKFWGVAIFIILAGAAVFSLGAIQGIGQFLWQWQFGWPMAKVIGGLIIVALGYVVLELEFIRHKDK